MEDITRSSYKNFQHPKRTSIQAALVQSIKILMQGPFMQGPFKEDFSRISTGPLRGFYQEKRCKPNGIP